MAAAPVRVKQRVHFGSGQERPLMPSSLPRNRLGLEFRRESAPNRGPGSYDLTVTAAVRLMLMLMWHTFV